MHPRAVGSSWVVSGFLLLGCHAWDACWKGHFCSQCLFSTSVDFLSRSKILVLGSHTDNTMSTLLSVLLKVILAGLYFCFSAYRQMGRASSKRASSLVLTGKWAEPHQKGCLVAALIPTFVSFCMYVTSQCRQDRKHYLFWSDPARESFHYPFTDVTGPSWCVEKCQCLDRVIAINMTSLFIQLLLSWLDGSWTWVLLSRLS